MFDQLLSGDKKFPFYTRIYVLSFALAQKKKSRATFFHQATRPSR